MDNSLHTAGVVGAVGVGYAAVPFIRSMAPSASVQAQATETVDLSKIEPGQRITVMWQGKPVFVRRRTEEEIALARSQDEALSSMPDQMARNANLGSPAEALDENRTLDENGEWLVQMGVCTHLGCVPLGNAGDYALDGGVGGWFCPCHGSHYDTSGRIRRGPAPENLPVPPAEFVDETTILLG